MKTKLTRRMAKARQKNPRHWVAEYLDQRHGKQAKSKPKPELELDETVPLEPAPAATGWVVLMVEPRMEGKAATALKDAGYVAWYPQTVEELRSERRGQRIRRKVNRPLFPRYLFAGATAAGGWISEGDGYGCGGNPSLRALSRLCGPAIGMGDCDHVSAIIGPVPAALLANLSDRQTEGEFEQKATISQFGKSTRVRITEGPFAGLDGIVHRSDGRRIEVLLTFLGAPTKATISAGQVEAA